MPSGRRTQETVLPDSFKISTLLDITHGDTDLSLIVMRLRPLGVCAALCGKRFLTSNLHLRKSLTFEALGLSSRHGDCFYLACGASHGIPLKDYKVGKIAAT